MVMKINESIAFPVSDAASQLEVHPSRVRALIHDGLLDAEKVGGRWFVDAWSLERRRVTETPGGRPFSPANAWALIDLWSGGDAEWISKWERSRLRRRLREEDLRDLAPRLRRRASVVRQRVHRGLIDRFADEPRVFRSGISAASDHDIDIVSRNELEVYVGSDRLEELKDRYRLAASGDPNLIVHVIDGPWEIPHDDEVTSPLIVALDLIESPDERCRRAGGELFEDLSKASSGFGG